MQPYAATIRKTGFVCCTLIWTASKTRPIFAIHKTHYPIPSGFICRAHFAQLANSDNRQRRPNQAKSEQLQRIEIARYNRPHSHDSENGNAGRLYKASIYPYRSGLYNPPALAWRYHNRCIPSVWPRFKAFSMLSRFSLLPLPYYKRLNASRIA